MKYVPRGFTATQRLKPRLTNHDALRANSDSAATCQYAQETLLAEYKADEKETSSEEEL